MSRRTWYGVPAELIDGHLRAVTGTGNESTGRFAFDVAHGLALPTGKIMVLWAFAAPLSLAEATRLAALVWPTHLALRYDEDTLVYLHDDQFDNLTLEHRA